jgi:hypothetical protein
MNNIINFQTARSNRRQTKASGITLCQSYRYGKQNSPDSPRACASNHLVESVDARCQRQMK